MAVCVSRGRNKFSRSLDTGRSARSDQYTRFDAEGEVGCWIRNLRMCLVGLNPTASNDKKKLNAQKEGRGSMLKLPFLINRS